MNINFKVTPSQKVDMDSRMSENGFDEISSYIKVLALKMQPFSITPSSSSSSMDESSVEISIKVTELQKTKIEENMTKSNCVELGTYLTYIALHGVVSAVVEVRSTGNLEAMLARIAKAKEQG